MTFSSRSISPLATIPPKWRRVVEQYREPDWSSLAASIAEAERLARQYPGRRQSQAARIDVKAIYAARVRATLDGDERTKAQQARDRIAEALDGEVSPAVRTKLEEARDRLDEALGAATGAKLGGWPILARGPLDLERGRAVARRPRTIANLSRAYYATQEASR